MKGHTSCLYIQAWCKHGRWCGCSTGWQRKVEQSPTEPCLWVTTASLENKAGGDLVWEVCPCLCSAAMLVWGEGLGHGWPVKTEALRRKAGDGGQSLWGIRDLKLQWL